MWSGAPQWANWALQPQQYQNMNNDEVDWAALAKQWIQMKETVDVPPLPPSSSQALAPFLEQISSKPAPKNEDPPSFISHHQPPPPPPPGPPPSQFQATVTAKLEEEGELQLGGEMDMEIEDDKDNISNGEAAHNSLPAPNNSGEPWQEWWNGGTSAPTEGSTGWGWGWGSADATHPIVPDLEPPGTSDPIPHAHYSTKQHQMGNYNWGQAMLPEADQISMRGITDYGHRSRRSKPPFTVDPNLEAEKEADFHLDAAQRKKLPLWIREGLEKMEREKQRKFEREQEVKHKEEMLRRKKEAEKHARNILKEGFVTDGVGNIVPSKSKFESDSEESNHSDQEPEIKAPPVILKKNSRFDVAPPSNDTRQQLSIFKEEPEEEIRAKFAKMTDEEKLEQMMIKLRRWMTEILLDVTTSMIHEVASDVISKARIKGNPPAIGGVLHCGATWIEVNNYYYSFGFLQ